MLNDYEEILFEVEKYSVQNYNIHINFKNNKKGVCVTYFTKLSTKPILPPTAYCYFSQRLGM